MKNSLVLFILNSSSRILIFFKYWNKSIYVGYNNRIKNVVFSENNNVGNNNLLQKVTFQKRSYVTSFNKITNSDIGAFTSIGSYCSIGLAKHPINEFKSTHPFIYKTHQKKITNKIFNEHSKTTIGNDVWIGDKVIIIGGVEIGDGAILGAGSVVTKNIKPYSINVGAPAKQIGSRETCQFENKLKFWWNLEDSEIISRIDEFKNI